jgi:hypothetical protein
LAYWRWRAAGDFFDSKNAAFGGRKIFSNRRSGMDGYAGRPGRCWINGIEPEVSEFQYIHEHIDRATNGIALIHPIIEAFRKQPRLLAIRP